MSKPDDIHGGDESELTPEQRAESRRNNSEEAFKELAERKLAERDILGKGFPIPPHVAERLSAINKKPIEPK